MARALLVAVLTLSLARAAQAQKEKSAGSPEEAVRLLVQASREGEADQAFAQMIGPLRDMKKDLLAQFELDQQFSAALNQKFGTDPASKPFPTLKSQLQALRAMEVLEKTEKRQGVIILKVMRTRIVEGEEITREAHVLARKEGDAWKVAPLSKQHAGSDDPLAKLLADLERERKDLQERNARKERLIKEVKDGKYQSREEAMRAYTQPRREN